MKPTVRQSAVLWALLIFTSVAGSTAAPAAAAGADKKTPPPKAGDEAPDFELSGIDGNKFKLAPVLEDGPVVLVVLRGFPGYQCPLCTAQVGQLVSRADKFKSAGANVVLVYPGPADKLKEHAEQFVGNRGLPKNFRLLIDPDYEFTKAYALRWEAPQETAYPSTFVIDKKRKIRFAKISKSHGDRASVDDVLKALNTE